MKPLRIALAGALLAAAALGASATAAAPTPTTLADISIPASDGVDLVGDVHLPDAKGRFPAIVDMEPYGRSSATTYLPNGYAHVNTDVRGSGKSGGALCLLCEREQQDVYDVVEWVAKQPWSNGKVGITGFGTFERADRAARTGRNPKTGATVKIKKTRVPKFRSGTNFKEVVSGAKKLSKTESAASRASAGSSVAACPPLPAEGCRLGFSCSTVPKLYGGWPSWSRAFLSRRISAFAVSSMPTSLELFCVAAASWRSICRSLSRRILTCRSATDSSLAA